jgi:hypothetical protein
VCVFFFFLHEWCLEGCHGPMLQAWKESRGELLLASEAADTVPDLFLVSSGTYISRSNPWGFHSLC